MDILMRAWSYFATNILQQPAWMIGLIVLIGYILLKKPWYDVLGEMCIRDRSENYMNKRSGEIYDFKSGIAEHD